MSTVKPVIEESWKNILTPYFNQDSFLQLKNFLIQERKEYSIYPKGNEIFSAFNHSPFQKVKVIILGQDPYHGPGQAHGLSFSVKNNVKIPPSLKNIYKELQQDLGIEIPNHGNLEKWASQGVLLLNSTLTVRAGLPGSHQKKGWEEFTDAVIHELSDKREHLVFLLWGSFAQSKSDLIDEKKHLILKAAHPSPFSAHRGFYGSGHFSKTNAFLRENGKEEIDWRID